MGYATYKQADSRWGKKNYNGSSTMATAGCGPTAVADLAYAVDGKTTPWDVGLYMQKHGYAIRNNGTAWAGIPAAMKAFGLTDVKNVGNMSDVFGYLDKGYCAVFLMKAGSRGGICWTTAGHFIAVTAHSKQNGKDYVYTRDPGGRNHTGTYCYQTQMAGLIPQVWVGKVPGKTAKPTTTTSTVKCIDVSEHQGVIDWTKVKAGGINYAIIRAGYGKGNSDKHFVQNISGALKAGIKVGAYWFMYSYTDAMASAEADFCIKALAPWKSKLTLGVYADWEYDSMNYAKKNKVTPSKSLITSMNKVFCEKVKAAGYKPGVYYNYDYKKNHLDLSKLPYMNWYALDKSNSKFTSVSIQQYGTEAVSGISGKVDMNWIFNKSLISVTAPAAPAATKATAPKALTLPQLPSRGYIMKGDKGTQVKYMQEILIHFGCSCGAKGADSIFGEGTRLAVIAFEKKYKLKVDGGLFGKACLAKAKDLINPKPAPKPAQETKAQKLSKMAAACAWPAGTAKSKYAYPSGSPMPEYKAALNKAFPDRSKWGAQTRAGASCDVFTGACVRASKADPKFPRGLDDQIKYLPKHSDIWQKVAVKSASDLKPGDVIIYTKKKGGGHVCIFTGSGLIREAGYVTKRYGCTVKLAASHFNPTYIKNTYSFFGVYRVKG